MDLREISIKSTKKHATYNIHIYTILFPKQLTHDGRTKNFMREAIRLSIENVKNNHGGPFGTVIVRNGEIIANGVNRVTESNDPTAHAEIVAYPKVRS